MKIPLESYLPAESDDWPGGRIHQCETILHGEPVTAVLTFSESLFTQQLASVTRELTKCVTKLTNLADGLREWQEGRRKGKIPTAKSVENQIREILSPQHMTSLVRTEVTLRGGFPHLHFETDPSALEQLSRTQLGRTFLVTDQEDWGVDQVVRAYRGQYHVEDAFKDMNQVEFLHFRPQYHRTDQAVRVHALYCVLALTLTTLARREIFREGFELSTNQMLSDLSKIKEVARIYPRGALARPRDHVTLSRTTKRQKRIIKALDSAGLLPQAR